MGKEGAQDHGDHPNGHECATDDPMRLELVPRVAHVGVRLRENSVIRCPKAARASPKPTIPALVRMIGNL